MPLKEFKIELPNNPNKDMFDELHANVSWNGDGTANISILVDEGDVRQEHQRAAVTIGKVRSFIAKNNLKVLEFNESKTFDTEYQHENLGKSDLE